MYTKVTTISNASGLHARPASMFAIKAKEFASSITVRRADSEEAVNAKSLIRILSQGIKCGEQIELTAEGPDETEAVESLVELLASELGE